METIESNTQKNASHETMAETHISEPYQTQEQYSEERTEEIQRAVVKGEENIQSINDQIEAARTAIGLNTPQPEAPHSVAVEQKKIEELKKEQDGENIKKLENNFHSALTNISDSSKVMLDALYERQQNRLTPLQSPEEFQGMAKLVKNLKNIESEFDTEAVIKTVETIQKIILLAKSMQPKSTGGQVMENPQNLEMLAAGAKKFSGACNEGQNNIGPEVNDEHLEDARKKLRSKFGELADEATRIHSLAARLRSNFR